MQPREFMAGLGAWPLAARAQQPALPMIGFVGAMSADTGRAMWLCSARASAKTPPPTNVGPVCWDRGASGRRRHMSVMSTLIKAPLPCHRLGPVYHSSLRYLAWRIHNLAFQVFRNG
jgi:hypothetical protein